MSESRQFVLVASRLIFLRGPTCSFCVGEPSSFQSFHCFQLVLSVAWTLVREAIPLRVNRNDHRR